MRYTKERKIERVGVHTPDETLIYLLKGLLNKFNFTKRNFIIFQWRNLPSFLCVCVCVGVSISRIIHVPGAKIMLSRLPPPTPL